MTNIYDVFAQLHIKSTAGVQKTVEEDLKKEDPPEEEAKAVLESIPLDTKANYKQNLKAESGDESTEGNDRKRSSRSNK